MILQSTLPSLRHVPIPIHISIYYILRSKMISENLSFKMPNMPFCIFRNDLPWRPELTYHEKRGRGRGGQEFAPALSWASTIRNHLLSPRLPNRKLYFDKWYLWHYWPKLLYHVRQRFILFSKKHDDWEILGNLIGSHFSKN